MKDNFEEEKKENIHKLGIDKQLQKESKEFLQRNDRFIIDKEIENKLLITEHPDGYLRCVKK